jgi:hypothetical protein
VIAQVFQVVKYFIFLARKECFSMRGKIGNDLPCKVLCNVHGSHEKGLMTPPQEGASGELIFRK